MTNERLNCPVCNEPVPIREPADAGRTWEEACPNCGATFRVRRRAPGTDDDGGQAGTGFEIVGHP